MLRLVGAGLPRTGTHSLKVALEQLLGGPCYHMLEVFMHPEDVAAWARAVNGELPDWDAFFAKGEYVAAVDWPASAFWRELAAAYPDAPVLLSVRTDADAWWTSVDRTVAEAFRRPPREGMELWMEMAHGLVRMTGGAWDDPESAKRAYEQHNAEVRAAFAGTGRLVEWRPADGWKPLCDALGVPEPDDPFPVTNTTEEFRARAGFDL